MTGKVEKQLVKALRRPGALPALLTAVGILAFLLVQGFLLSLFGALSFSLSGEARSWADASLLWSRQLAESLTGPVPIALGVFVAFWQIAPIAPILRLAHVVTRAILAAAIGATLLWLMWFVILGIAAIAEGRGLLALGELALPLLWSSLSTLVSVLPAVVLGAVLLWGWLQRHPLKHTLKGTLDEV